jgi:hypothetical protein
MLIHRQMGRFYCRSLFETSFEVGKLVLLHVNLLREFSSTCFKITAIGFFACMNSEMVKEIMELFVGHFTMTEFTFHVIGSSVCDHILKDIDSVLCGCWQFQSSRDHATGDLVSFYNLFYNSVSRKT